MKTFIFNLALLAGLETTLFGQPTLAIPPTNQTASLFADATFRVSATGTPPLSYQWRFNDADLIGKTNATVTVTNVQRTSAGNYTVVVTNLSGSVTSQVATLTITPFNSLYFFGFSWTDTHNCAPNWPPPLYYNGRPSNGPMWPEFISTNLGMTYVEVNNYAHCGAEPTEILDQVGSFAAPKKPQLSAYFMWLGASDAAVLNHQFSDDILKTSNSVQRLYSKGAREIIVQALQDFTKVPYWISYFGSNETGLNAFRANTAELNATYLELMKTFLHTRPDLRIIWVDTFSRLDELMANSAQHGIIKTDVSAIDDPTLADKSFQGPGADYAFWNSRHGTSKLNEFITSWNLEALTDSILERLEARIEGGLPNIQMNHLQIGRDYTLQKSIDLTNWQEAIAFTASAGTNLWTAPPTAMTATFYRLKWRP